MGRTSLHRWKCYCRLGNYSIRTKGNWIRSLTGWQPYDPAIENHYSPRALKGELTVNDEFPRDTYFDFDCSLPECAPFTDESAQWHHGAFFVNGFNVGRYHQVGPQKNVVRAWSIVETGHERDCRRGTSQRNGHGQIYRYTKLWKRLIKEETKEALNNFCLM